MSTGPTLSTSRLLLRTCATNGKLAPFAAINADPRVMEFFPKPLDRDESDAVVSGSTATSCGTGSDCGQSRCLAWPTSSASSVCPCRRSRLTLPPVSRSAGGWPPSTGGGGYATEAARASLEFGFHRLGLAEIVSFTVPANRRSRDVMERIGDATFAFRRLRPSLVTRGPSAPAARPLSGLQRLAKDSRHFRARRSPHPDPPPQRDC